MFFYREADSPVHRLDPRTKVAVLLVGIILPLSSSSVPVLLGLALLVLLYGALGRVLDNLMRIRLLLLMATLFSLAVWSLFGEAPRVWGVISVEGSCYGFITALRLVIMISGGAFFLGSSRMEEVVAGLEKLKVPYRGAFVFSTALRLVPALLERGYTVAKIQQTRGVNLDRGNPVSRLRRHLPLLIPVFISVVRDTNTFAMALESRGFGYGKKRSRYLQIGFRKGDLAVFLLLAILLAGIITLKI